MATDEIVTRIREVVARVGRIAIPAEAIRPETDLWSAGMTSRASVELMLSLESEFDIEFPDRLMRRDVFSSVAGIRDAVDELINGR